MKPATIKQYNNDLRIILIYIMENCDNKVITQLSKRDFRNLSLWLSNELNLSNARVNRLMSCCRSLMAYIENEDDYDYETNVAAKIKGLPKENVRDIVFLSNDIIMKLYNFFMKEERYKEATLLALAYESAARKNELAQVLKDSIKPDRNCTNFVIGKRGKKFSLLYFDLTKKAAKKYLEQRGEDDIPELFITKDGRPANYRVLYDWVVSWRKIVKKITGKDLNFNVHSLRHSSLENYSTGTHEVCKIKNLDALPIEKLKILAHHENLETTSNYLLDKSNEELEQLFQIKLEE